MGSTSYRRFFENWQGPCASERTLAEKLEDPNCYNIFFNKVDGATDNCSIEFKDLLTLGPLQESLHITFNLAQDWLLQQYSDSNVKNSKIDVWYGKIHDDKTIYNTESVDKTKVDAFEIELPPRMEDHIYRNQHSKMSFFYYRDDNTSKEFIRVAVMTANLTYDDWNTHNQGIWISPACELLPFTPTTGADVAYGESRTMFKATLLAYLHHYRNDNRNSHIDESLKRWIEHVRRANFKHIRVVLIASAPGIYNTEPVMPENFYPSSSDLNNMQLVQDYFCNSHNIISKILKEDVVSRTDWRLIAQTSTIGKLGPENVLLEKLFPCLTTTAFSEQGKPNIWIIYPSEQDFHNRTLFEDPVHGFINQGGLFYKACNHASQIWIEQHLLRWSAERTGRTRILPHIKSYCRVSPDSEKLSWFLLSSACLTTNAWGYPYSRDSRKRSVGNYEVGVLFFPKYFDDYYFAIEGVNGKGRTFPFMYDLKHAYGKPYIRYF
ncbi:Tyrosyl-DNA phosphodiesterase [Popillia japonica]|uniref:Tyrosyl-DNA phosphodiesterase n=1 Tax=Popillia japonica TaxID=7064 RepID=A0AAW1IW64_POPJA